MKKFIFLFVVAIQLHSLAFAQTYCSSNGINPVPGYINNVNLSGLINNNSTYASGGYSNYTNLSATLTAGTSYTITINNTRQNTSNYYYYYVWIDYNKDGDFADAGESILSLANSTLSVISGSFVVPSTVGIAGTTRIRITMSYVPLSSCGPVNFGEVEDYNVVITCPTPITPIMTGNDQLCSPSGNQTYGLIWTADATTYFWTLTNQTTSPIAVFYPDDAYNMTGNISTIHLDASPRTGSFNINVQGTNTCGAKTAVVTKTVYVNTTVPPTPGVISGPASVVNSAAPTNYSLSSPTSNTVYEITPSNAVTSSTTNQYGQVTVDWNNAFVGTASIRVKVQNGCGASAWSPVKTVQVSNPLAVYGPASVCNNGPEAFYQSGQSTPYVAFEILPASAVESYTYNKYANGNVAVNWDNFFVGNVTVRVSVNGGPWSPYKNVTVSQGTCNPSAYSRQGDDQDFAVASEVLSTSLYPNPSYNGANLRIENTSSGVASVQISDAKGTIVYTNNNVPTGIEFSLGEDLPAGLYSVKVICGESHKVLKFVKSN
jgi:hypothetical protein